MAAAPSSPNPPAARWEKYELPFVSAFYYPDPLREVDLYALFTAPSGAVVRVNGFWDGGKDWKIRLMPDETGEWQYETVCSNPTDTGLHHQQGTFSCKESQQEPAIYQRGAILHRPGDYHLRHADGTPFLWVACTAWNGTLKSTEEEWDTYLQHRREHHYSVIQFVTTQWRGADRNSRGQVAFSGQRSIFLHPEFFQHLDRKIDRINAYGLVAAPVLLWALPRGEGKALSPGYALPRSEAILLARYMVARYGAHHVVWLLGGDGFYTHFYQSRWKHIGRAVFEPADGRLVERLGQSLHRLTAAVRFSVSKFISRHSTNLQKYGVKSGGAPQDLPKYWELNKVTSRRKSYDQCPAEGRPVALHPMGRSWIGEAYAQETWLDIVGYQSGHGSDQKSVEFITRGSATQDWSRLPSRGRPPRGAVGRPTINMEPCYEEIGQRVSADDVRHASYWSLLATPVAGISYGANGIWPWIRKGERILNHGALSRQAVRPWRESLDLPGSLQVGHLAAFIQQFDWWTLQPDPTLLVSQPGDQHYLHFVSVVRSDDYRTVLAYFPTNLAVEILNPKGLSYCVRWFDPVQGHYLPEADGPLVSSILPATAPLATGNVLVLEQT